MQHALVAGNLYNTPFGSEVALEDDETAGRLERVVRRPDDHLAGGLLC